jgi:hypothetical protein
METDMLTPDQRRRKIEKLAALPAAARATARRIGERGLDTPYCAGGWTARQVLHHLADSHMNAFVRMKLVASEEHPALKPYDQDQWAKTPDARTAPVEESLSILDGLHPRMVRLLESVKDEDWARTAYHPEHGDITLETLLEIYSEHGAHHLAQIEELARAGRGA